MAEKSIYIDNKYLEISQKISPFKLSNVALVEEYGEQVDEYLFLSQLKTHLEHIGYTAQATTIASSLMEFQLESFRLCQLKTEEESNHEFYGTILYGEPGFALCRITSCDCSLLSFLVAIVVESPQYLIIGGCTLIRLECITNPL